MTEPEVKKELTGEELNHATGGGRVLHYDEYNTQTCSRCGKTFMYKEWIANDWNCPNCSDKK